MLYEFLSHLDLSEKERNTYLLLLQLSALSPAEIAQRLTLPRTTAQNILIRMEQKGFVQKNQSAKGAVYEAVHPEVLRHLLQQKKIQAQKEFQKIEDTFEILLPQMVTMLKSNKSLPQIRFYRGREGARTVLFDTLNSKTELRDFASVDAMFEVCRDINDEYVAAREKTNITKRSIISDTPFAREIMESGTYSPKSHKAYKWIPNSFSNFSVEMNIYDGRISYLTYVEDDIVGVIIENPHIYETHLLVWNLLWNMLPEVENPYGGNPRGNSMELDQHGEGRHSNFA